MWGAGAAAERKGRRPDFAAALSDQTAPRLLALLRPGCAPQDLSYEVKSNVKRKEKVKLLHSVSGLLQPGVMTALVRLSSCS